ncbi:AMP-binding protein [Archangium lansingense]|uniref:AMP-binding protein n=1 Tax=Archangium lansingense TaxID=2995310 RepID=UPI003B820F63
MRKILEQLEAGAPAQEGLPAWLEESWKDPEGFTAALASAQPGRSSSLKSRTGQFIDFFQDLVARHAGTDLIALRTWDKTNGWRTLSYRQLQEQASRRAATWAQQGIKPGAKVCLLYHPGPELLVSLAAALGLGACISFLQPQGWSFVSRRLEALAPEHIASENHQLPLLQGFEKLLLDNRRPATAAFSSYAYKPKEHVGMLFSPLADPTDKPVPLTAADAWSGALVDGTLTFNLGPGEHLAAPGFHPRQHLPALLFCTLLRGATFVHLEHADVAARPALLMENPPRALGVTAALRDVLLDAGLSLQKVGHWFRNPEEPLDWQRWQDWVKQCGLSAVPTSNVLIDPAAGGAVLCSPRRAGNPPNPALHTQAFPAPGRAWMLKDGFHDWAQKNLGKDGPESPTDSGLFTLLPDKDRPRPYILLTKLRGQYHYVGTIDSRKEGRVYLQAELLESLEELPSHRGTSVLTVPTGMAGKHRQVLLVFTGAPSREAAVSEQDIQRRVELQLGPEHIPDRIERFQLYPRHDKKGRLDEAWCHSQYLTGALHRKSKDPLFQALTALRGHILEKAAEPGDDAPASPS